MSTREGVGTIHIHYLGCLLIIIDHLPRVSLPFILCCEYNYGSDYLKSLHAKPLQCTSPVWW